VALVAARRGSDFFCGGSGIFCYHADGYLSHRFFDVRHLPLRRFVPPILDLQTSSGRYLLEEELAEVVLDG
jgi:hypothetical protein